MSLTLKDIFIDDAPGKYIPSAELKLAVETAYALKRPLLLSGEPGTGKTDAARWVADTLRDQGFAPKPRIYHTKSSSTAQDLFYHYDAVAHFRETNTSTKSGDVNKSGNSTNKATRDFIELKALGLAFANALGANSPQLDPVIAARSDVSASPSGSVVLIDEIDKAPRDFPNDLLNELEHYEFDIKETATRIALDVEARKKLLIILTSNFEKSLPEPFLRRCVYFHISFPEPNVIVDIIVNRLNIPEREVADVRRRVDDFFALRENNAIQKKPSTSEALDWIRALKDARLLPEPLYREGKMIETSKLLPFMPVLLKKKDDIELFRKKRRTDAPASPL